MGKVHVHIHAGDSYNDEKDPALVALKNRAEASINAAILQCKALSSALKDRDDKMECGSAVRLLENAKGKLIEVVSA